MFASMSLRWRISSLRRLDAIWTIACEELAARVRNRWVWIVGALFLASALAIGLLGSVPAGVVRLRGGGAVMASLMNLSVYLVPLLALVLGAGAIIDEKARGTLDLVLTYPVSPAEVFAGTFLGYGMALFVAIGSSLLPVGVALRRLVGVQPGEYLVFAGLTLLLGLAFLSLAFLVSIVSRDRARAVAHAIFLWVVAVLVYDLVLVGVLVLYRETIPPASFGYLLLLNPSDVFRLLCFHWVGSAASPLGLATVRPPFSPATLTATLAAWVGVPLFLTHGLFARRLAADRLV